MGERTAGQARQGLWVRPETLQNWVPLGAPKPKPQTQKRPEPLDSWEPTTRLFVDILPRTAWFSNLRSELLPQEWDAVKRKCYRHAGYRCQACGGVGPTHPVEAHERWEFFEDEGVQVLSDIVALCPACHEATHYGLARVRGRDREAMTHLCNVNDWPRQKGYAHMLERMSLAERWCRFQWRLDARGLLDYTDLSPMTRQKIEDHAQGRRPRTISETLGLDRDICPGVTYRAVRF